MSNYPNWKTREDWETRFTNEINDRCYPYRIWRTPAGWFSLPAAEWADEPDGPYDTEDEAAGAAQVRWEEDILNDPAGHR